LPPLALVKEIIGLGITQVIVLDLAAVGKGGGPIVFDLCRQIRCLAPHASLFVGGGVRGIDDLARLRAAGASGALVSSWLHSATGCQTTPLASP
jgi:uncharacterized protein related to proFAR isomerase